MIVARAIGDALRSALEADERVVLLGEDLADPYGGAFKVTRGLSTDFEERVRSTPISEGAIAGIAAGLALAGYRPIAEVMFGDFLTLCFDQLVNHIAKYEAMYAGQVSCPVIIRTPSGGGRGYGPTHSQSLEKHFVGVPGLKVVAASLVHDPGQVLRTLLTQDSPVLYVEHKLLYPLHLALPEDGRID
ncbi:MAG TPA: alpha-ketoacid dehydrogenase subunit beta, partial [Solirubrobacter sp.]|nr:alpha-ketoacid dehydrogenase subunit beta [Solirubrobacter sp.]